MLKQEIQRFCQSIGLDTIGFIPCRKFEELVPYYTDRKNRNLQNEFEEEEIEKRIDPNVYMPEGKTILSIAFPYYPLEEDEMSHNGFSIYTKRWDYHRVLKQYLEKVCQYIEGLGGQALSFVDSNSLPERYIAYLAGIGFIGRNNMVITKKYGSYVFLGEIITDLDIACKDTRSMDELSKYIECGECEKCLGECPTKSINKNRSNPNICLSYITQKKDISDKEIKLLKGNVFGCDFCQLKCPYNEEVTVSPLKEFETLEYMNEPVYTYANMNNKYFKEKINKTSCGWRGKNVIRRNAIIHLHQKQYDVSVFKGDSSYLNEYIDRLTDDSDK